MAMANLEVAYKLDHMAKTKRLREVVSRRRDLREHLSLKHQFDAAKSWTILNDLEEAHQRFHKFPSNHQHA